MRYKVKRFSVWCPDYAPQGYIMDTSQLHPEEVKDLKEIHRYVKKVNKTKKHNAEVVKRHRKELEKFKKKYYEKHPEEVMLVGPVMSSNTKRVKSNINSEYREGIDRINNKYKKRYRKAPISSLDIDIDTNSN